MLHVANHCGLQIPQYGLQITMASCEVLGFGIVLVMDGPLWLHLISCLLSMAAFVSIVSKQFNTCQNISVIERFSRRDQTTVLRLTVQVNIFGIIFKSSLVEDPTTPVVLRPSSVLQSRNIAQRTQTCNATTMHNSTGQWLVLDSDAWLF